MKPQLDNKLMSSVLLWLDHTLLDKGEAYTNVSGQFYRIDSIFSDYYAYASPFKQIVADTSIPNANILSGVYLNNNYVSVGESGYSGVNFNEGQLYFSQSLNNQTISGNYAIKDFNVYLTNEPEYKLLFETKYEARPKINRPFTGLAPQTLTFPCIFVKNDGSVNEPFAFGGTDTTVFNIKLIVLANSQFSCDAVSSILRDKKYTFIPIFSENDMPYNNLGYSKNGNYNYTQIANSIPFSDMACIANVSTTQISYRSAIVNEIKTLNPGVFPNIIDMRIELVRNPRL